MGSLQKPRAAIVQHFFPHYRRAVIETLARSERVAFTFLGDDHEYLRSIEPAQLSSAVAFEIAPTHHLWGPFMWQWRAITIAFDARFDTVVFHPVPHWPCTWLGAALSRLMGKRVVFWGQGMLAPPRGLNGLIRRALNALPHAHLLYGHRAKQILMTLGWAPERLQVIYNSLDLEAQQRARANVSAERILAVRGELFGDESTPIVACPSRLITMRKLDQLIQAVAVLRSGGCPAAIVLIGDGPARDALAILAGELGVPVHFEGACYDEARIAELLMASSVVASPGRTGLTVMHGLAYGVPVVSHDDPDDQAPEGEAIIPGVTGSTFVKDNAQSLASALAPWLKRGGVDPATKAACIGIIERFWNPDYQRRAIERIVCGQSADDLFDARATES